MKEPSYFVIKRCLLHGPTGRTMVLLRCIRHESGFHRKPTRNLQQNKTTLSQTVWQIDCWLEFWYYSVPCARFLSKLWHVCLNVVWTLNIARKHMGGLGLTIDSTNQVGAEHKKCSKPKAQKAQNKSKNVCFKASLSQDVYKNRFNLPLCFHFFQWTMCNMEAKSGFLTQNSKFKKHHGVSFQLNFQQHPSPTLQASKHCTATLFYLGLGNLIGWKWHEIAMAWGGDRWPHV